MKTFNGKSVTRNLMAIILGFTGLTILGIVWGYHTIVHYITMPKDKWINPLSSHYHPPLREYSTKFCYILCNGEAVMIHQLKLYREGFGQEYCQE